MATKHSKPPESIQAHAIDDAASTSADIAADTFSGAQDATGAAVIADNAAALGFVPEIARILTLPLLKMKPETGPVYIKFTAPFFVGKQIKEDDEKKKKEPPIMANVVNLSTGEMVQIMLGTVLQGILNDDYPEDDYVNRAFMLQLMEQKRGRSGGNYNTYKVAELKYPGCKTPKTS